MADRSSSGSSRTGWSGNARTGGRTNHGRRSSRGRGGSGGRHPNANSHLPGQSNLNAHKRQEDEASETLSKEVGSLVINGAADAPEKLKVLLAATHERYPERLHSVLNAKTTWAFPNRSLLAAACAEGRTEQADILLRSGVDPNEIAASGATALAIACFCGHVSCVRLLVGLPHSLRGPMLIPGKPLPAAANPRILSADGVHALMNACCGKKENAAVEIAEILLEMDRGLLLLPADIGGVALHGAAGRGFPRVVETLLKYSTTPSGEENPGTGDDDLKQLQLQSRNGDGLSALQAAEDRCDLDMRREREEQHAANRSRSHGGGGNNRRGAFGRGGSGSRGGRGGRAGGGGRGNGGRGRGRGRRQSQGASDGTRSESGESRDGAVASLGRRMTFGGTGGGGGGGNDGETEGAETEIGNGWGCVVALVEASGVMPALHGSGSLRKDSVRERYLAHVGLHGLLQDVHNRTIEAVKEGNDELANSLTGHAVSLMGHISTMYKAIIKPARNTTGSQQATSSQLLAELIRPRDYHPYVLDDSTSATLLEIVCTSSANPHVVRALVLMLAEIATTKPKMHFPSRKNEGPDGVQEEKEGSEEGVYAGVTAPSGSLMFMYRFDPMRCCQAAGAGAATTAAAAACDSTKSSSSDPSVVVPYHTQACLAVWDHVLKCICRLGRMLLYGLQGQQEGDHGEVLYEREGALFDTMWELLFRFLLPHAQDAARYLETPPAEGESPTHAILSQMASQSFDMLWTGLGEALEVIEGVVGGNEPDRFGALIRGYLMYLYLMDNRIARLDDLLRMVKENRVESGLAGGGGGHGGRRGGRGPGRNPKSILTVIASSLSLEIPTKFKELVVKHMEALSEILDADPTVLENRLVVLLRIEGAVDTTQKLEYIINTLESRAGRSKGLELSINRMSDPYEMVEMVMQQLAAAPPRAMGQMLELKFVNEAGEGDGPMRELVDMLMVVFCSKLPEDFSPSSRNASRNSPQSAPPVAREAAATTTTSSGRTSSARLNPLASPYTAPWVPTMSADAAREAKSSSDGVDVHGGPAMAPAVNNSASANALGSSGMVASVEPVAQTSGQPPVSAPASGFWKCFPLFKVYAPDPAAVVPCVMGALKEQTVPSREENESRLRFFRAAGRLMALSLLSATPLGVVMPEAMWAVLLGLTPTWEEFCGRDTQYLESMKKVLEHEFGSGEDGNGLELYFSVSERKPDGKVMEVPLHTAGETKRVNDMNKKEFVYLAAKRRCLGDAAPVISAIRAGISDVIQKNLLSVLLPSEVATIVSGPQGNVDFTVLKANVWYVDSGFDAEHRVLRWFWKWSDGLKEDAKRRLLVFWSGSSRMPPFGFQEDALNESHRWAIAKGLERDACPDVSTCDRRMTLPVFSSKEAVFKFMNATIEFGYLGYTRA